MNYQEMEAGKQSRKPVQRVHGGTREFTKDEKFGLVAPSRKTAVSQFANRSDGFQGSHKKETLQFFSIPGASSDLPDVETIAAMDQTNFFHMKGHHFSKQIQRVLRRVNGTISYFQKAKLT
jgi:four helix bundle protein